MLKPLYLRKELIGILTEELLLPPEDDSKALARRLLCRQGEEPSSLFVLWHRILFISK